MTETSNAIYNFKNHIMTNAQKVIIQNLEKAIMDNHEDEEAVEPVIKAFKALVISKSPLIVPVEITNDIPDDWEGLDVGDKITLKEDIHFHPMTIHEKNNEAEKKEYMVAFTRLEEADLGPAANTCTIKAGSLFNIVLFRDNIDGIVINPFGDMLFKITKEMIESLFTYCIDHGPCKSEKYYDEHQKEEKDYAPEGIDLYKALNLADEAYHNQSILSTNTPLLVQSMGTASILGDIHGGPDLIVAGLFAKAINEGFIGLETIKESFGLRAAQILSSQTEDKDSPWYLRKLQYIRDIAECDDIEVKVLAIARAVSELRSIYSMSHTDNTIIYALEAPAHYMAWYYKELCKIFSLYAYEPITEHIYAEMVTLYKKVFMNIE